MTSLFFATGLFFSTFALAAPPQLSLPIACEIGKTCFIQNYFDHDPGPAATDFQCKRHTYNGHTGNDFRIIDLKAMQAGVNVIASADGIVRATRDGMEDINLRDIGKQAIKGREAGNSVVIVHGDGWETQYAHMKKGSIAVKAGQVVKRGDVLGQVGLSGSTEFPHVHLDVRHERKPIDPFTGEGDDNQCAPGANTLWQAPLQTVLAYKPTAVLGSGFISEALSAEQIEQGQLDAYKPDRQSAEIVYWIKTMGIEAGDEESIQIYDALGVLMVQSRGAIPEDKAQRTRFVGRKLRETSWKPGKYRGTYVLIRKGQQLLSIENELELR